MCHANYNRDKGSREKQKKVWRITRRSFWIVTHWQIFHFGKETLKKTRTASLEKKSDLGEKTVVCPPFLFPLYKMGRIGYNNSENSTRN